MSFKIGEGKNLDVLLDIKRRISRDLEDGNNDRWDAFRCIADCIHEACENKDILSIANSARSLKNKLRRPSVKRALAEANEKKNNDKKDGICVCAQCGKIIQDSKNPCIDGALCSKCAFKDGRVSGDDKKEKHSLRNRKYI